MTGYTRDRFPHWRQVDENCDVRDAVLKRDGTGVQTSRTCKVTRGSWFSAYDAKTYTDPDQIDIDHMVPLANAWRSGADGWTDEQRTEFANDLTRPQLMAVSAVDQPVKGRPGPVAVEAAEPRLLVRVRAPVDRGEVLLEADGDRAREERTTGDAGIMPSAEQRTTDIVAGPGGVMTDEVGVVTGDLTLRSELTGGDVRAAGAVQGRGRVVPRHRRHGDAGSARTTWTPIHAVAVALLHRPSLTRDLGVPPSRARPDVQTRRQRPGPPWPGPPAARAAAGEDAVLGGLVDRVGLGLGELAVGDGLVQALLQRGQPVGLRLRLLLGTGSSPAPPGPWPGRRPAPWPASRPARSAAGRAWPPGRPCPAGADAEPDGAGDGSASAVPGPASANASRPPAAATPTPAKRDLAAEGS